MASGIRDTLAACGSKQQQEDGDDVSKKDAVCYLCNWSQGYTRRSLAQVWADKSGETMDWFTDVWPKAVSTSATRSTKSTRVTITRFWMSATAPSMAKNTASS